MCRTSAIIICTLYFVGYICSNEAAVTEEQKKKINEKLEMLGVECIKDNPLTEDDINSLRARKEPSGANAPCFLACMMKKMGVMDSDGKIQKESVLEVAKEVFQNPEDLANIEEYLHACASVNTEAVSDGPEGCERAMLAYKCMVEKAPKFGFDNI